MAEVHDSGDLVALVDLDPVGAPGADAAGAVATRRRSRARSLEDSVGSLVDELLADVDALVEHLMAAVRNGVPRRYRSRMGDEGWDARAAEFIPAVLERVRDGGPLPEAELERLQASSRDRHRRGFPLVIALLVCRAGVAAFGGYVVRTAGPRRLSAAVVVLGRLAVLSHDTAQAAATGYPSTAATGEPPVPGPVPPAPQVAPTPATGLAPVPRRILELAALGRSTREIAKELHYSDQAVTYHLGRMMKQFDAPNRTALIARAVQRGVVTLPERDAS